MDMQRHADSTDDRDHCSRCSSLEGVLVETLNWLLAHRRALAVGPTNRYGWRLDVEQHIRNLRSSIEQRDDHEPDGENA